MIICLAGIKIEIKNRYSFLPSLCRDYLCEGEADFSVEVSDADLEKEREMSEKKFSDGYLESVCVYREIAKHLPEFNAFILHSAAVEIGGEAYLFLAKSGVGKSTHIRLLKEYLGEKVCIINGDKPIVRFIDSVPFVFGTPWQGKENWGEKKSAKIRALCFLNRGEKNEIFKISPKDAVLPFMRQILIPNEKEPLEKTLKLSDEILNKTTLYKLFCTPDIEAAKLSASMVGEIQ